MDGCSCCMKELSGRVSQIADLQSQVATLRDEIALFKKGMHTPSPTAALPASDHSADQTLAQSTDTHSVPPVCPPAPTQPVPSASYSSKVVQTGTTPVRPTTITVTSYYQRPRPKPIMEHLVASSRTKCCALYVGNIDSGCSSESIAKWCEGRDVQVLKCSVSERKYFGVAFVHVVLPADCRGAALSSDFWPPTVRVREWRFQADRITSK